MLCEKCGKRNASVMYTQIVNGKKSSINICSQCAAGESLFDNFGSLLSFGTRPDTAAGVCPCCGMTQAEFVRKGRMGCGKCYDTFRRQAKAMLQKIQDEVNEYKNGKFAGMFPEMWLPKAIAVLPEAFTEQNHMVNSTMKIVRGKVEEYYADRIEYAYTAEGKELMNEKNMASL